jgi:hypothetical protein
LRGRGAATEVETDDDLASDAAWLGERLRRLALGLTAALVTARAYWPSEPDVRSGAGGGLTWDLAVLAVVGLAVFSGLIGGTLRFRWSWADPCVVALMLLVGRSTTQAYDRRTAINLAWDWAAFGMIYVLVRILPRTRTESSTLLGALAATAVAISVYGLYQVAFEYPVMKADYVAHRAEYLRAQNIEPGSSLQAALEDRLLNSNEVIATFALPGSLAGFLVGPLVVMFGVGWQGLFRGPTRTSRLTALVLAALPALAVLICLVLTKSRSGWVGLAVGLSVLALYEVRRTQLRTLAFVGLGGLLVVSALVVGGLATRQLDREVLTESTKSLRYRWGYWIGAWRVITESPDAFWHGHGPGNFTAPYLTHKLPDSSEELSDPHNFVLEIGSTAGFWGVLALLTALGLAFRDILAAAAPEPLPEANSSTAKMARDPSDPPRRTAWLLAFSGGGWLLAVVVGDLNPFSNDLFQRWLILGSAWLWAALLGLTLWRRVTISGATVGAAVLAILVNLLAAGGIGFAAVALMLWSLIALGLNLRDDRSCGRLREVRSRIPTVVLAVFWAALLGSFIGAIVPFWKSEAAILEVDHALNDGPKPDFAKAEEAYLKAIEADVYNSRPWLGLAQLRFLEWESRGAKADDRSWKKIEICLENAVRQPRNQRSWSLHREHARIMAALVAKLGNQISPSELMQLRAVVVRETRRASQQHPTLASLHAELAETSADIGMFADAAKEAREALRLDRLTPHADKKLRDKGRERLQKVLPEWEKAAENSPNVDPSTRP